MRLRFLLSMTLCRNGVRHRRPLQSYGSARKQSGWYVRPSSTDLDTFCWQFLPTSSLLRFFHFGVSLAVRHQSQKSHPADHRVLYSLQHSLVLSYQPCTPIPLHQDITSHRSRRRVAMAGHSGPICSRRPCDSSRYQKMLLKRLATELRILLLTD
jgi:hypothetical protein